MRSGSSDRAAVGVVVVSFDSARDLEACLDALLAADGVAEVVVVDNASTDGSPDLVRRFTDPRLRLVEPGTNTGFAGGCNLGFEALSVNLPWVAFVNPDVVVRPDCMRKAVDAASSQGDVAGVAPRLMRPDGITVDSLGQVLSRWALEVEDRGYGRAANAASLEPSEVLAACGALAVYRREALQQVAGDGGPWAEHFFCFWEDLELGWRLTNRGWRVLSVPDAVAVHGRGAGAAAGNGPLRWRRPPELEACVLSNRWMTLARHLDLRDALLRLPILMAWDVGMAFIGGVRRPTMLRHLRRRMGLVYRELRRREQFPRKRLSELPW